MLNKFEAWYVNTLSMILAGHEKEDRTKTGTLAIPFAEYTHDLRDSYPLVFSRWFNEKAPIVEMDWMVSGDTNIKYLKENGCPFWNAFAVKEGEGNDLAKEGDIGPVYGYLWRHWPNPDGTEFDQVKYVDELLDSDPDSRRMVVSSWHPSFIPDPKNEPSKNPLVGKSALTACHFSWEVLTEEIPLKERKTMYLTYLKNTDMNMDHFPTTDEKLKEVMDKVGVPAYYLDLTWFQRSSDWVLGVPANWNMYASLALRLAKAHNMIPRFLRGTFANCHIYSNHVDGAYELLRSWNSGLYINSQAYARLNKTADGKSVFDINYKDFTIENYEPGPKIKFKIAV